MFAVIIVVCLLKPMCIPTLMVVVSVGYMTIYVPIVMYSLRLFIVVLQELHCLPNIYPWSLWISISTQSFVSQLCLVIEIR